MMEGMRFSTEAMRRLQDKLSQLNAPQWWPILAQLATHFDGYLAALDGEADDEAPAAIMAEGLDALPETPSNIEIAQALACTDLFKWSARAAHNPARKWHSLEEGFQSFQKDDPAPAVTFVSPYGIPASVVQYWLLGRLYVTRH